MQKPEYILKRSPKRKTIGISIGRDNVVVVSAPVKTPLSSIEKFVAKKSGWINKHLSHNSSVRAAFQDVIEGRAVLVAGAKTPLIISDRNVFSLSAVCVTSLAKLKKLYIDNLGGEFYEMLKSISARTGLKYSSAGLRTYKSRWGCCSKDKALEFNYKLLMLPREIWEYVIVHELCHTLHMDHSRKFWECVRAFLPDYSKRRKALKEYSFLCPMY